MRQSVTPTARRWCPSRTAATTTAGDRPKWRHPPALGWTNERCRAKPAQVGGRRKPESLAQAHEGPRADLVREGRLRSTLEARFELRRNKRFFWTPQRKARYARSLREFGNFVSCPYTTPTTHQFVERVPVLLDTQGPEIRTGTRERPLALAAGAAVTLAVDEDLADDDDVVFVN